MILKIDDIDKYEATSSSDNLVLYEVMTIDDAYGKQLLSILFADCELLVVFVVFKENKFFKFNELGVNSIFTKITRLIVLVLFVIVGFSSCSKEPSESIDPIDNWGNIYALPFSGYIYGFEETKTLIQIPFLWIRKSNFRLKILHL
jgi:hypothetical protein